MFVLLLIFLSISLDCMWYIQVYSQKSYLSGYYKALYIVMVFSMHNHLSVIDGVPYLGSIAHISAT